VARPLGIAVHDHLIVGKAGHEPQGADVSTSAPNAAESGYAFE
jgi:hypothetical protein